MNSSLHDLMLAFCERQLTAALRDSEASMHGVTADFAAARAALGRLDDLPGATALVGELRQEIDRVVIGLQFFDAHAQRVQHVLKVMDLLLEGRGPRVREQVPDDWRPMLTKVRSLLSTESEWRVFGEVFPGEDAGHHKGDDIELF